MLLLCAVNYDIIILLVTAIPNHSNCITEKEPGLTFIKLLQEPRAEILQLLQQLLKLQNKLYPFIYGLRHLINSPKIHICVLDLWWALVKLCVIISSVQRRGLVAGALPDHRRERLYPQQLCGSIWLHPSRRVNPFIFFSLSLSLSMWHLSVFHQAHGKINPQTLCSLELSVLLLLLWIRNLTLKE